MTDGMWRVLTRAGGKEPWNRDGEDGADGAAPPGHVSRAERSYGAAAHVAPLAWGNVVPVVGSFAVTLLVWWWMRESGFVSRQARASINFQLSMTVHYTLALGYVFVSLPFAVLLVTAAAIFETVSAVRAARSASAGRYYRYRMCIRFVKDE